MTNPIPKTSNPSAEHATWIIEREWNAAVDLASDQADKLQAVWNVVEEYKLTNRFARGFYSGIIRKLEQALKGEQNV